MTEAERVIAICKQRDIPISHLEQGCGFGNGWLKKQTKEHIAPERLEKIAAYLDLPIDYLRHGKIEEGFFLNKDTARTAQEIAESRELSLLFAAARDASPEDLMTTYNVLLALKKKERHDD